MSKTRTRVCAAVTAMGVVGALAGCGSDGSSGAGGGAASSEALSVAIALGPQGFDPYSQCVGDIRNVMTSAYDTLLRLTPEGTYEPSLAESYEFTSPTELSLKLRPGVTFEDGTPLDAEVVKANLERAAKTPTSVTSGFVADAPTITVDDDLSLTITVKRPDPSLTWFLSSCGGMILHPDLVADPKALTTTVNGTGPYTYDAQASVANSKYVFQQKEDYWNAEAYPFETVTWQVVPDFNAGFNALTSGQVDIAQGTVELSQQGESAGLERLSAGTRLLSISLNDRAGELVPALGDVRVRQALSHAIDREGIIRTFFGEEGRPTAQQLLPEATGYDPDLDDQYAYDPEKAKELLAEAGYADGFTIPVLSTGVNQFSDLVEAVGSNWADIGVTLEQVVKPVPEFIAGRSSKEYAASFAPLAGFPSYDNLIENFGPDAVLNPFRSTDPALTKALEQATADNLDEGGDAAAITEAQTVLLDQAWYAPIGYNVNSIYHDPKTVTGIEMSLDEPWPLFYDWQPAS